jgi:hypothetical protein
LRRDYCTFGERAFGAAAFARGGNDKFVALPLFRPPVKTFAGFGRKRFCAKGSDAWTISSSK